MARREIAPIIFYATRHISQFNPAREDRDCDAERRDRKRLFVVHPHREIFHAKNEFGESDVIA